MQAGCTAQSLLCKCKQRTQMGSRSFLLRQVTGTHDSVGAGYWGLNSSVCSSLHAACRILVALPLMAFE